MRLSAQQQLPELLRERRRVFLEEARDRDLQVARIELFVHFWLEQVVDQGDHDVVLKAQQLRDALRDPLMDHLELHLLQIHLLVEALGERHLRQQLLVLVEIPTVLVDARTLLQHNEQQQQHIHKGELHSQLHTHMHVYLRTRKKPPLAMTALPPAADRRAVLQKGKQRGSELLVASNVPFFVYHKLCVPQYFDSL